MAVAPGVAAARAEVSLALGDTENCEGEGRALVKGALPFHSILQFL